MVRAMTADELQEYAEAQCRAHCGGQCIAWGQAAVLFAHGPGAGTHVEASMARNARGEMN